MDETGSGIPHIARGFAGGIGNTGAVCGAVAGGVLSIGLAMGRRESMVEVMDDLALNAEFRRRFEAEMGSINCRELTGLDLTTEEGVDQLMQSDVPERVCMPAVNVAQRIAVELLEDAQGGD
jgi:C_GCAxxG_C_C family probable redox protein